MGLGAMVRLLHCDQGVKSSKHLTLPKPHGGKSLLHHDALFYPPNITQALHSLLLNHFAFSSYLFNSLYFYFIGFAQALCLFIWSCILSMHGISPKCKSNLFCCI